MNPPFADMQDVKHIEHAWTMLKPGGLMVALCANGPRQQAALPAFFKAQGGYCVMEPLPDGSFASSGTNVRVALVIANKPGAPS
jgi:hypothetical protein